jgi:hypothetical protein
MHKIAPLQAADLRCERSRMLEEILRDVAEDHTPRRTHFLKGAERYQTVAAPNIKHDVTLADVCIAKDAVADWIEPGQLPPQGLRVAPVTPVK